MGAAPVYARFTDLLHRWIIDRARLTASYSSDEWKCVRCRAELEIEAKLQDQKKNARLERTKVYKKTNNKSLMPNECAVDALHLNSP